MKTLESFQQAGAEFLASRYHAALGDERGLGKTVQALRAASMVGAETGLVTCPASVRFSWLDHITEEFGAEAAGGWQVVSYDQARRLAAGAAANPTLLRDKYDVWIGDELHFCKTLESQRTHAILGGNGLARRARYKWCLSGTFAPNHRPIELFPMLKALAPKFRDITFDEYTRKYCGAFYDGRAWNYKGAQNLDELRELMDGFILRRTQAEVYPNRRAPIVTPVPVALSHGDLEYVTAIEDEIGGREMRISSRFEDHSALGDASRLLRALGNAMRGHVARFVDDLLAVEDKVVVFAHHSDVIDWLKVNFASKGYRPVVYRGGMSDTQKADIVAQFQSPECRVFIGQRQAAGTGINGLQKVCSTMVIAEPSWTPGETEQLIGRLDRIGQEDPIVNAYIMYAKGTLSAVVVGVHDLKEKVGERLSRAADVTDFL
jgi:SNF2 family DNA or RNA helicase